MPALRLGRILEKLEFATVALGGFVSFSGNISTYQEVLIKNVFNSSNLEPN
ncbi:hypothetical protein NIES4072_07080 [Nostoc commune NIES-4072]|uniref:Uncharacterized protein n=1 Tax=Nostoc commune NIES-4072 TaxID=2005467 RepID=A0A2R5FGV4_NOSCO|nr:hypothetical protein NIES4070_19750 [Nostoc commune HK-02]GBG17059.1 hypothetical protein NIES4072_07080 [Nostoc commune NIES-4072]